MSEHNTIVDTPDQVAHAVPTQQMSDFMRKTGIDPEKYSEINAKAESVKNMLDERLEEYRRQKAIAR